MNSREHRSARGNKNSFQGLWIIPPRFDSIRFPSSMINKSVNKTNAFEKKKRKKKIRRFLKTWKGGISSVSDFDHRATKGEKNRRTNINIRLKTWFDVSWKTEESNEGKTRLIAREIDSEICFHPTTESKRERKREEYALFARVAEEARVERFSESIVDPCPSSTLICPSSFISDDVSCRGSRWETF